MSLFDLFKKKEEVPKAEEQKAPDEPQELSIEQARQLLRKVEELSRKTAYRLSVDDKRAPKLCDSKFGGIPYWDAKREYPVSISGEKLMLLAQINLSDVKDCELLPSCGLLQFFIVSDDLYGADFDNYASNDTFRVVYHDVIDDSITEEDVLALDIPVCRSKDELDDEFPPPIDRELAINIEKTEVSVGCEDHLFEKYLYTAADALGITLAEGSSAYKILPDEIFDEAYGYNLGHWLFGYAYFTQSDPREYMPELEEHILLFQMDSDFGKDQDYEIMWGDVGVGNFFITPDDLKALDFSKVVYNWDCG